MNKLNPRQHEAMKYIDGPLLVLAGAGSGKTSVITRKIAYLIQKCGIKGEHIAAVTFTNKAAREMRERVGKLVSGEAAEGLLVSTFHQLGLRIIREERKTLELRAGFSIFDNQDSNTLIRDILIQDHGAEGDQAQVIQNQISNWKNDGLLPDKAIALATGPAQMLCAQAYKRYNRALRAYNALDFDDLIMLPGILFTNYPDILEKWQNRIHYLLVDEYQDTNISQYELVKQLVGLRGGLTAVGDDDQSIYAWRGARPENLEQLREDFPGLKVVMLEQNYRSTRRILKAANTLIANNDHVFEKQLWSELGFGDPLRVIRCTDETSEVEQVVAEILDHRLRKRTRLGEYAVLYRGNHQARLLELALQQQQVPYQMSGGQSFFARNEVKDIMAYLRLVINADDDNAFLRIANVPRRKLGTATLEALGECARKSGTSMLRAAASSHADVPEAGRKRLREFSDWLDQTRQRCRSGNSISGIRQMLRDIQYDHWLDSISSSEDVAERRMGNVDFLVDSLQRVINDDGVDIEEAISKLVLRDLMEQQEEDRAADDSVQLMTLHASKGLEYPHVFIIGMEENLLPHRVSVEEDNIAEERRLAYVGITRAQQSLTMTMAAKRRQFGEVIDCEPSRFIEELPADDLQWQGGLEEDAEVAKERANETLAGLRDLLG
ncbi:ATP-dependent DNA helicase Rep [Halieaceae bacterium IMCC14734]|uniref:ATP-dependent DNA helicase Rep n=1 Tax=Candidatus Litorirhabdus singularis TaxID=2518993 RepID=A0ABT3TB98_9GAMM|nr:UvrD-helicase domain-containing protein [Candidatus Litorirhabdus singularis]MCX2979541.1 ATP-dependent DNA helicase Rep [Candidatus Litorirhabdus singularis]